MRKLLFLLCLFSLILPVFAQDEAVDCSSARAINRQIDSWYQNYLGDRGEVEPQQSLTAASDLATNINNLLTTCGLETNTVGEELVVEQTGLGTPDSPFVPNAPAVMGDVTMSVTNYLRPADALLLEEGFLNNTSETQEYVMVYLDVTCAIGSTGGCSINLESFRLIGASGFPYIATLANYETYLPERTPLTGGAVRSGVLPFFVDKTETDLQLVYYPEANAAALNPVAYYFAVEGASDGAPVTSLNNELLIRNAPNSGAAPLGIFRTGQTGFAQGRNEDGTWLYVQTPEATGWVSAEFVEIGEDIMSLPVVEE